MSNFFDHIKAGFPALWVITQEPMRAMAEYSEESKKVGFKNYSWDCQAGIKEIGNGFAKPEQDPVSALGFLKSQPSKAILFLMNFHRFIKATEIIQEIANLMNPYKASGKTLVILSPSSEIPLEVEKLFTVLRFELPDRESLLTVLRYMAESSKKPMPDDAGVERIIESGKGLTSWEYENALALSLIVKKKFDAEIVLEQKKQLVRKNASLILEDSDETLENLGGMDNLKEFCLKVANSPLSKGVLLLGVPGTGKSHFSKGLGKALGIPTAALDFGRMFGSLVGESEERIRGALDVVDSFSPCVLRIDEIEKGLSGIQSSGQTDGGTGSRVFGTFLNWLNDHRSRVFVVATCNDIQKMPPEFLRAERWDAIFFVDLPTEKEREIIFNLYREAYKVKGTASDMAGWSGAEIKSLCRIAAMMGTKIEDARQYIMPLSQSMAEKIEELRNWARTRTIPASNTEPAQEQIKRRLSE
jgi:hypothetical protein